MEGIRFNHTHELGVLGRSQRVLTPEEREKRACEELATKLGLDSGLNIVATPRAAMNAEDALAELRDKLCLG